MEKDQPIIINPIINGFIVDTINSQNTVTVLADRKAFQSMEELLIFIKEHFKFRNEENICSDEKIPEPPH